MSDSGKQIGNCQHGKTKEWCIDCLREENARLKTQLKKDSNKLLLHQYTREEIFWMESGKIIDALIAKHILGLELFEDKHSFFYVKGDYGLLGNNTVRKYSTENNCAMEIFEKYKDCGWDLGWHRLKFEKVNYAGWFIMSRNDYNKKLTGIPIAFARTIPLVICRASLLDQYDKMI